MEPQIRNRGRIVEISQVRAFIIVMNVCQHNFEGRIIGERQVI